MYFAAKSYRYIVYAQKISREKQTVREKEKLGCFSVYPMALESLVFIVED